MTLDPVNRADAQELPSLSGGLVWTCAVCTAISDGALTLCWNCAIPKGHSKDPRNSEGLAEPTKSPELVAEDAPPANCWFPPAACVWPSAGARRSALGQVKSAVHHKR